MTTTGTRAASRFSTKFVYQIRNRSDGSRLAECQVDIEKTSCSALRITLSEGLHGNGNLIRREFPLICTQFHEKFLKGVPPHKTRWFCGDSTENAEEVMIWDGKRFFRDSQRAAYPTGPSAVM